MIKEFKTFIMRGNVMDIAIGIVIGAAFAAVVKSLIEDVIMPPIGLLLGKVDFNNLYVVLKRGEEVGFYKSLAEAKAAGAVTLNYGLFLMSIINFLIIGLAIFLVVKGINKLRSEKPAPPAEPTTKECPFCLSTIAIKATRCPNCTSQL